jgi:protein phosphatase
MICTDGIIDGVWEKHIHAAFLTPNPSPENIHHTILNHALENAGRDDTTMITLTIY